MKISLKIRGFTLVEIMIAVLIIGMLSMMVQASLRRVNLRAKSAAYQNDCRVFAEAFTRYAQETGGYPPDGGPHFMPAVMVPYLNRSQWMRVTPLGGYYDWDNIDSSDAWPDRVKAAIAVSGNTMTVAQLQQIDEWIDDGNIATGNFRVTRAGATVIFIIEK